MVEEKKGRSFLLSWNNLGILLSTFSLIVLFFVFYVAYSALAWHVSCSATKIHNMEKDFRLFSTQVTTELTSQTKIIQQLQQAQAKNKTSWDIAEAYYWVKIANQYLTFENNIPLALTLLKTTQDNMRTVSDPRILPIQKALALDIGHLQRIPTVDIPMLYTRLSAMNSEIDHLPFPNQPSVTVQENKIEPVKEQSWWQHGLHQTWQSLQHIVVVRYDQSNQQPLLSPEQKDFFYQNLHAAVENAMWAVLHQKPDIYRMNLQQVSLWIKKYAAQNTPITQNMLVELDELQKIEFTATPVNITTTLQAFQDYFASIGESS